MKEFQYHARELAGGWYTDQYKPHMGNLSLDRKLKDFVVTLCKYFVSSVFGKCLRVHIKALRTLDDQRLLQNNIRSLKDGIQGVFHGL